MDFYLPLLESVLVSRGGSYYRWPVEEFSKDSNNSGDVNDSGRVGTFMYNTMGQYLLTTKGSVVVILRSNSVQPVFEPSDVLLKLSIFSYKKLR